MSKLGNIYHNPTARIVSNRYVVCVRENNNSVGAPIRVMELNSGTESYWHDSNEFSYLHNVPSYIHPFIVMI